MILFSLKTRKAKDFTYLYGENSSCGTLTPFIHKAFDTRVDECVLDGEMLAYSHLVNKVLPFGTLKNAAKGDDNNTNPIFKLFDVLWVNGRDISKYPLKERIKASERIFNPIPNRFEYVARWSASTATELKSSLERIILNNGEGLVIKSPLSSYSYGNRADSWIKLKPDYFDEMSETSDLLVVGGYYSTTRTGVISSLLCALFDDSEHAKENDEVNYLTFTRVGTGFTASDLEMIKEKFDKAYTKPYSVKNVSEGIKISQEKPDILIDPDKCVLLCLKN